MYYYLNGTVAHIDTDLVVVDVGRVGYACHSTLATLSQLAVGKSAKLYTHLQVKEDSHDIYAFFSLDEKACFLRLIGVSGVGPRSALSILSVCTPDALTLAIATDDDKALTQASGVGKKLAQRIILELKDKMQSFVPEGSSVDVGGQSNIRQAQAALAALGYTSSEVSAAIKGLDVALPTEELVSAALKRLV